MQYLRRKDKNDKLTNTIQGKGLSKIVGYKFNSNSNDVSFI